jgi:hypothetical protein
MIKNILLTSVLFIAIAFGFTSCDKVSCPDLVNAITTGADAYKLSPSTANCLNYKKAIQAWLDESKCADENAVQTNIYKNTILALNLSCP